MKGKSTIFILGGLIALVVVLILSRRKLGIVWDPMTEVRLQLLAPELRTAARKMINTAEDKGIYLRIPSDGGLRTFEEQQTIYNKGRIAPGNIVTYAMPGQSYHNYGLAFDVVEIKDGKALWNNPNWLTIGAIGKRYGFDWGGDWMKPDKPHFEMTFGKSPYALLEMKKAGKTDGTYIKFT